MPARTPLPTVELTVDMRAAPRVVVDAFFDSESLAVWWGAVRSVTTPRALGPYAIEWLSEERDELLGRLGGVLRGTVMQFDPTRGFLVADVYWLPPLGPPVGPMALEISCRLSVTPDGPPCTRVRVAQTGFEEGPRWRRYYEVIGPGWARALDALKVLVEKQPSSS